MEKEKEEKKQTEKDPVPGQQIGMYSKNEDKDVRQMVRTLNPGDHSMTAEGNRPITLISLIQNNSTVVNLLKMSDRINQFIENVCSYDIFYINLNQIYMYL